MKILKGCNNLAWGVNPRKMVNKMLNPERVEYKFLYAISIEPLQGCRRLRRFIEGFYPSLCYIIPSGYKNR